MIQKNTAFFADPPSRALKMRWYTFASPSSRSIVGTKKLRARIGPEGTLTRSASHLPQRLHLPAASAAETTSSTPPTALTMKKSAPRVPKIIRTPLTTSV